MDPTIITPDSVTVNAVGQVHNITVTADADMVTYTLTDGETYTEVESPEGNYTFTVTAKTNYQIDSVKYKVGENSEEKSPTAGQDGAYSIPKSEITDDVVITVAASKIQYTVTPTVIVDGSSVTDFSNNATISFSTTATDGKIDAGSSLTISASLKDAAKATHKISKVAYTMGSDEEVDLTENWNGSTTISNVSGNVAITVTVTALETYKVSFSSHANIKEVAEIKVNDAAYNPAKFDSTTTDDWEISATEGSTVSFKLVADEKFQVTKVTDGDQSAVTPVAGVYTIENLSANVALNITTGLTTDANGFSFALETGSDRQSATMTVEAFTSDADIAKGLDTVAGVYNAGESALTLNEKIVVSFTAKEGYELGDVKVGGVKMEPTTPADTENNTPAKYEVTLEAGADKSKAITVATDAKGSEAEKSFAITNSAAHMTLDAVEADGTAITPAEGKYLAAAGKKRITFSVTADGAYEPVVTAVTNAAEEGGQPTTVEIEADEVKTASGKTTYKYLVLASQLADEYTIKEIQAVKTISFTGGDNTDISIDGRLVNVSSADEENQGIEYVQGRKLTVKVAAKENAVLNSVSYTIGDANEVKPKVTKNVAEFTLTLTDDTKVIIDATGALVALPLADEKGDLTPVKGTYNVSYDGVYTAAIGEGVNAKDNLVNPTEAKLFSGNAEVAAAEGKNAIVSIKNKKAEVDLRNADVTAVSGKKLTLKVTVGTGEDAKTFAYTLQVSKAIAAASDITVPANAKQPTDTEKTYAVSTKGEISRLQARVEEAAITAGYIAKQPEIKDGKLVITTGQTVTPTEGVKVTVYTGEGENEISKDVLVKTTALISDTTTAPKVTLKSATDISMTLSMSAKTDADVAVGSVYYKVTATATGTAPTGLEQTVTAYVPKEGDAQDYKLNVASVGTALGQGSACSYKVTVSLVHAKDKNTALTADNEATQKVAESKAFATADNKPFATQNPAWEANLKLKKGTTTIYTGQTGVSIATPQFTKTTTYTGIVAANVSDLTYRGNNALTFTVENDVIKASASASTAVGKHTVQVVAVADDANSMVASKATIVVTVVKGINRLGVSVPATSMYKAVNKAATLKATPVYNGDASGKDKTRQPKTKKVKWELVKADNTSEAFADPKVQIKNGTVTVAKDYVIKADESQNTFKIKVTVDNDKAVIGDAGAAYSDPIKITNEGLDMDRLVIVGSDDTVLAISNESKAKTETKVAASDLDGATVKILTAGADVQTVGQTYVNSTANTELSYTDMTYKSSKAKDVFFETDRNNLYISVAKANTKPVLTVTANDGSKATLGIKLNVDYDTPAGDLALRITDAQNNAIYDPTNDGTTVSKTYAGSATNMLFAELMQNKDGSWGKAENYVNYDIKVTGGKKVGQEGAAALITTDKAEVKIELTNKSKTPAVKTTYTLTNSKFVASGTKVKAKVIGSLRQVANSDEQDVKLELEIPTELATSLSGDGKTAAVKVDVDWSKLSLKNNEDLGVFDESLTKEYTITNYNPETKKATVTLAFTSDATYAQKSYALKVSVGSKANDGGEFTPAAPVVAVTLKVEKTKKFTFKPTTSYTIATRDGGAVITGKASVPAEDYALEDLELLNANFGGQANEFTRYFKISNGKLMINDGITAADISNLVSNKDYKNHLTGYLTYNATTDKSYYELSNGTGRNTVKITVKLNDTKAVAKYTAEAAEIMNKADAATDVQILANKAPVTIMHAKFDTTKTDAAIVSDAAAETALVSNGKIRLSLKETTTKSSIKATVYVVPVDSYYESEFAEGKTPTLDTYKSYGTAVTITLKVKQPTTMTLEQAKAAVTAWVEEVKADTPEWLTGEEATVKSAIITEAGKAIVADNAADFTVAYKQTEGNTPADDFTFNAATESADGTVSGTLLITLGDASEEVEFAFTIPQKQATVTVEKVEIKKDGTVVTTDTIQAGSAAVTYTAEVTGTNLTAGTDNTVTWELTGSVDNKSTLVNGTLTVDADETATSLTVKATSTKDPTKSATVTVTVTAAEAGGGA